MARALVIGGTLYIGRRLVERLLESGDEVVIMHRSRGTPFGDRVAEIRCDRNDPGAVHAALADSSFDVVFDNVYDWQRGTTGEQVRETALAASRGLGRYVFMSSVAAYGGGSELDESSPLAPPDFPNAYVRDKADGERALFELHAREGLPVTTMRPAFVYGPHNPFAREAWFWDRIVADRPVIIPGDGSATMQWVHADDVARAMQVAAQTEVAVGSAYNLGNDPPITQVEWVQACARAAGREAKLVFIPREQLHAAGGSPMVPPLYFGEYLDIPPIGVRVERVRAELGVELRDLDAGLRDTFQWYRAQPRLAPDFSWEDRLLAATN